MDCDPFTSPESAFYEYQSKMEKQHCQVCNNLAVGFHHGAFVCEACKKFFKRYFVGPRKSGHASVCGDHCDLEKLGRRKCADCRFKKCLEVGMVVSDVNISRPIIDISKIPCRVCGGKSSGFHFGSLTCEGCKGFFRRASSSFACGFKEEKLTCVSRWQNCVIDSSSRTMCKFCRYQRCLQVGMSRVGSRIGRQPNAVKYQCAIEISRQKTAPPVVEVNEIKVEMSKTEPAITSSNCCGSSTCVTPPDCSSIVSSCSSSHIRQANSQQICSVASISQSLVEESADLNQFYRSVFDAIQIIQLPIREVEQRLRPMESETMLCQPQMRPDQSQSEVWDSMMQHFDIHSHLIVSFAKRLAGFNTLSLLDRRSLVRDSMYRIILLNLAIGATTDNCRRQVEYGKFQYNYFDFLPNEYSLILSHFPSMTAIMEHVSRICDLVKVAKLSRLQLGLLCVIQMFQYSNELESATLVDKLHQYSVRLCWISILDELTLASQGSQPQHASPCSDSTILTMTTKLFCPSDITDLITVHLSSDNLNMFLDRWQIMFVQLPNWLNQFNKKHHSVLDGLKISRPDLPYSELYTEMFRLTGQSQPPSSV